MLELRPTDFLPLQEFGLKWRFTDPKYKVLPPDAIADLHPLSAARAAALVLLLDEASRALHDGSDASATTIDAGCGGEQDYPRVIGALHALPIAPEERVVVVWDKVNALETSWRTFCGYWDGFCYPSSDDVTICPIESGWMLDYHHGEWFAFSASR